MTIVPGASVDKCEAGVTTEVKLNKGNTLERRQQWVTCKNMRIQLRAK